MICFKVLIVIIILKAYNSAISWSISNNFQFVVHIEKTRNGYKVLLNKPEGKDHSRDTSVYINTISNNIKVDASMK